ncbi:MAG: BrnT family toxin [Candidatus Kapabacteria bacterium]|nr:BrnT family toxin [Candidatus Kapabacteria bacterium]
MNFKFDWDEIKAVKNLKKHGISFDEAKTVFFDDYARTFDDTEHSIGELRELIFGYSNKNRLLIVSFTLRNEIIRIINARKVTKNERKLYEEYNN